MRELTAKDKKEAAEIRLINAYADRPGLYNKTIQKTLSPEDKERLSVEVAESTNANLSVADVKRMIRNLRDQFKKAYNKNNPSLFRHFHKMLFLSDSGNDGRTNPSGKENVDCSKRIQDERPSTSSKEG
ncbi:uncharacterized protein LOC127278854 [Leptopilina boulardi]|uniref:uncharacterized protein LOC127278854 n=1 Tax=Leptopilina boulardi TaxID=63433 RepID=UPI0021F6149F|nr:uncharacterized protein LOC127278854 [Leptopilina boulardi]